jgi:hypothetical protein
MDKVSVSVQSQPFEHFLEENDGRRIAIDTCRRGVCNPLHCIIQGFISILNIVQGGMTQNPRSGPCYPGGGLGVLFMSTFLGYHFSFLSICFNLAMSQHTQPCEVEMFSVKGHLDGSFTWVIRVPNHND